MVKENYLDQHSFLCDSEEDQDPSASICTCIHMSIDEGASPITTPPHPVTSSQDIPMVESQISLETVGSSSLGDQLLFLHVPRPQQEPARAVQKCRDHGQPGRNGIALDISGALLGRIELRRHKVREVPDRVGERHAKGPFVIGSQRPGYPGDGEGGGGIDA